MRLEYISKNLTTILVEIMKNKEIMDLLVGAPPKDGETLKESYPKAPFNHTLFPTIFNPKTQISTTCEIHVYYPDLEFKNGNHIQDVVVLFDIMCDRDLWLIEGEGKVRPLEIMRHIFNTFHDKSVYEVGELHFSNMHQLQINDNYNCIRLVSRMMQL